MTLRNDGVQVVRSHRPDLSGDVDPLRGGRRRPELGRDARATARPRRPPTHGTGAHSGGSARGHGPLGPPVGHRADTRPRHRPEPHRVLARPAGRHGRRSGRRWRTPRTAPTPAAWSCARPSSASSPSWPCAIGASMPSSPFKLEMPGRLVLRRALDGHPEPLGRLLLAGRGVRRPLPVHAGLVGHGPPVPPASRRPLPDHAGRLRPVVAARHGHRPPVQPRRLLVRRPGRDGQPPHEPVPVRALRTGQQRLHRAGRPAVGQRPGALRPDVPPGRRLLRPDHLPQRAGHHRAAAAAGPGRGPAHRGLRAPPGPPVPPRRAPSCSP